MFQETTSDGDNLLWVGDREVMDRIANLFRVLPRIAGVVVCFSIRFEEMRPVSVTNTVLG
jgi:hypothetical protein